MYLIFEDLESNMILNEHYSYEARLLGVFPSLIDAMNYMEQQKQRFISDGFKFLSTKEDGKVISQLIGKEKILNKCWMSAYYQIEKPDFDTGCLQYCIKTDYGEINYDFRE